MPNFEMKNELIIVPLFVADPGSVTDTTGYGSNERLFRLLKWQNG